MLVTFGLDRLQKERRPLQRHSHKERLVARRHPRFDSFSLSSMRSNPDSRMSSSKSDHETLVSVKIFNQSATVSITAILIDRFL